MQEVVKDEENSKENQGVTDTKVEDQEEEKLPSPEGCAQEEKNLITDEKAKVPRAQRRPRVLQIKVTLLDNAVYECELDVSPQSALRNTFVSKWSSFVQCLVSTVL